MARKARLFLRLRHILVKKDQSKVKKTVLFVPKKVSSAAMRLVFRIDRKHQTIFSRIGISFSGRESGKRLRLRRPGGKSAPDGGWGLIFRRTLFVPLTHRSYRFLWIAQVFSDFGNFFDIVALEALIVYEWGLGAGALAAFAFAAGLPWILIGLWVALLVDRISKKRLMLICCILRIPFVIGFILAPDLYWLLPLVFLKEILDVLFDPARQASLRWLVPRDRLEQANALSQLSLNTSKIAAPAFGGLVFAVSGSEAVFLLEAGDSCWPLLFAGTSCGGKSLRNRFLPTAEMGGFDGGRAHDPVQPGSDLCDRNGYRFDVDHLDVR